jgi:hypothetical protein
MGTYYIYVCIYRYYLVSTKLCSSGGSYKDMDSGRRLSLFASLITTTNCS